MAAPETIAIDPDDHHATDLGVLKNGVQFFLTTPFIPAIDGPGCIFVAIYLFGRDGAFMGCTIKELGPRSKVSDQEAAKVLDRMRQSVGVIERRRITIQPFQIIRKGVTFGFVVHPPDEHGDGWQVTVEPGDYMAFYEPWDGGVYDT